MLFAPQKLKQQRPTVVIGAGELGLETAALIRSHQERVIVIDPDLQRLDRAKELGHEVVHAEVEQNDPRAMNYLDDTRVAVVTYSDTQQCYSACSVIRLNYGIPVVVSQVTNPAYNIQFEKLGVQVVNPAEDRAALLVMLARNPATFSILMRMNNNKEISELIVENEAIAGKALCEIELPGDVLVIAIRRKGDIIVPHGETRLERGDALTMVGSCDWIEQAKTMIENKT
jgi:Trk K+ transport system NAD-binding subunit